ncbi:MAG: BTAD domain-containing putative transcriptional regulator [Hyphomicrobiaceae bacterium]
MPARKNVGVRIARGAGMDDGPLPKFKLSLLGRFELTGSGGPVDLPSKKLAGLLAYLACMAPQPQSRDKLAALLWGSHFDAQARQNLRQALFRLRRVLGQDALIGDDKEISLCPGVIDCDAARFEVLIGEGSSTSLASAIDLYKGILLADVTVTEEAWSDWLAGERQRLENLALDAMNRHAEQELQSGNAESALKAANQAIAVNALREDAHRLVIRALAANGRRADALKHYDRLAELLKRELDVGPDPITQTLVAGLRKSLAAGVAEAPSDVTPPLPLPDRPSIAVLPFANMSGDPEQEYFADGVVEDILTALSRIRWLFVIARQSSFSYKGRAVDVKQIGRELGVRYVVEGSGAQVGQPGAPYRPAHRCRDQRAHLGRSLRARAERHLCPAGRDHAADRCRYRAERARRRDQARACQADRKPHRLRSLLARAATPARAERGGCQTRRGAVAPSN